MAGIAAGKVTEKERSRGCTAKENDYAEAIGNWNVTYEYFDFHCSKSCSGSGGLRRDSVVHHGSTRIDSFVLERLLHSIGGIYESI